MVYKDAKENLRAAMEALGQPSELAYALAAELGTDNMISRLASYCRSARPSSAEEIVDEMLAIRADRDRWVEKKSSEYYSGRFNEYLNSPEKD